MLLNYVPVVLSVDDFTGIIECVKFMSETSQETAVGPRLGDVVVINGVLNLYLRFI